MGNTFSSGAIVKTVRGNSLGSQLPPAVDKQLEKTVG